MFVFLAIVIGIVIAIVFFGYPLLIFLLRSNYKKSCQRTSILPSISVIIPSCGSAKVGEKISNTLLQYPEHRMQIIVVYSGRDKAVLEELRSFGDKGLVELVTEEVRTGKSNALNLGLKRATGEICVITDSDSLLDRDAIRNLVSSFTDQKVGAVSGELVYFGSGAMNTFQNLFFNKYKRTLKNWEAQLDSCSYAPGELLAFRRELIDSLPCGVSADDYYIALEIRAKGYKCTSEPTAIVYEKSPQKMTGTVKRTSRVVWGTFSEAARFKHMLFNRRFGFFGLLIFPNYVFRLALLPCLFLLEVIFLSLGIMEVGLTFQTSYQIVLTISLVLILVAGRNFVKYAFSVFTGMVKGTFDFVAHRGSDYVVWEQCKET